MRLEVIDSFGDLEQIECEWSAFAAAVDDLTPFQSPEWLLTWWRHFGSGKLHVLVFRIENAIAGIIPCFLHNWNGRSQLTLIGSGISDYLEPAIAPLHAPRVMERLREHLLENTAWQVCEWQDLSADTRLQAVVDNRELYSLVCIDTPCSEIKLSGSFDEFWAARSKDLRRNLRRYGQRAKALGPIEFAVTRSANPDLMNHLIRLHGIRWQKQGGPGMIAVNNSADFLREVSLEFERFKAVRFFSLRLRDEVVAISLGFPYRNTLYSYLSAFDPQYEILGFGRQLLYESVRHAFDEEYTAWNFCRGDEPYKLSWGAKTILKSRLILTRAHPGIS